VIDYELQIFKKTPPHSPEEGNPVNKKIRFIGEQNFA
jgi:hypothetical protein